MVSRKDKLSGLRGVVGGVIELAAAADPSQEPAARRLTAGFAATSIVAGAGQARGHGRVHAVANSAGATLVVRGLATAVAARRRASSTGAAAKADSLTRSAPPTAHLSRQERLRAVNDVLGGLTALGIATDASLSRRERLRTATVGASAIAIGAGRLRRSEALLAAGGAGYVAAIAAALAAR